jgi:hypothetical protein
LLDKLVENGSDREEAEVDYRNAILEAEQRMAARRMGFYDEAPAEAEQQAEQPAEQPAEPQPVQQPQPGLRLQHIEAEAAQMAAAYVQDFGVQRALTSEEIASLSPEHAARYAQYGQAVRSLAEKAQAQTILVRDAQAAEFAQYAAAEEAKFERAIPAGVDRAELNKDAMDYLRTDLGLSEHEITRMWNSDPQFRSATAQRLIMDATLRKREQTKGEQARKQLNSKRAPVPPVQRSGARVATQSGSAVDAAQAAFDRAAKSGTTRQQVEAGARLVEAQKAARERERGTDGRFSKGFY